MSWTAAEERLAQTLPGYESRTNQTALAHAIEGALADGEHLLGQAGTGTGKSLSALIPAIEYALENDTRVVVSTATKALQSQYVTKDVPFLLANLGVEFSATLLKGRRNYICKAQIHELKPGAIQNQDGLLQELEIDGQVGDLDELITELDMRDKPKLTSSSDECPGKRECRFGSVCFAEAAKTRAKNAQIVIVNHSMLITDLAIRARTDGEVSILGDFGAVFIDEAHELEAYATSALGTEFSQGSLTSAATQAANFLGTGSVRAVTELNRATTALFARLGEILGKERTVSLDDELLVNNQEVLFAVLDSIEAIRDEIQDVQVHGDDDKAQRRKRLTKRFSSLSDRFSEILGSGSGDLVRWIEASDKGNTILKTAPLHVGPFLHQELWSKTPGVLLSATLAMGSDFSYVAERLGIDRYRSFDAGTPFDYPKQAALFVPEDFDPSPARSMEWRMKVGLALTELAKASGGRALFLFTSVSAMRQAHAAVAPGLEAQGVQVLMQGQQSNRLLTEAFKADETSVLFAVRSFMTGFDVQGDALRLVVVDKLPFPVPTDVINKARCDAHDATSGGAWKDSSFNKITVPSMALVLQQAFGRLIRTKDDEGLVAILDSRLWTKSSYGPKIMRSLPPARRMKTLGDAVDYLREVTERRG